MKMRRTESMHSESKWTIWFSKITKNIYINKYKRNVINKLNFTSFVSLCRRFVRFCFIARCFCVSVCCVCVHVSIYLLRYHIKTEFRELFEEPIFSASKKLRATTTEAQTKRRQRQQQQHYHHQPNVNFSMSCVQSTQLHFLRFVARELYIHVCFV